MPARRKDPGHVATDQIRVRLSPRQKALVAERAAVVGESLSAYVLRRALEDERETRSTDSV